MRQFILSSCDRLLSARSEDDIVKEIRSVTREFDFDGFTWTRLDAKLRPVTVDSRPEEWQRIYNTRGYAYKDAVIQAVAKSSQPFTWEESLAARTPSDEQKRIFSEARDFGMTDGLAIPIYGSRGVTAFLGFYSGRSRPFHEAVSYYRRHLHLFAMAAGSASHLLSGDRNKNPVRLTQREEECLSWAAAGKSIPETALILSIGDSTVKAHLKSACNKLGAVNKLHAVVKAILVGAIAP